MKTILSICAMTTLVITALPAEAGKKKYRSDDTSRECKTIEVTGPDRVGPTRTVAKWRARGAALKLWRADVVKQLGGEGRPVGSPLVDRCDAVFTSELRQSCRYQQRACK